MRSCPRCGEAAAAGSQVCASCNAQLAARVGLSPATDARMRVQFYLGDIVFISIDTPWKQVPTGWRAPKDH